MKKRQVTKKYIKKRQMTKKYKKKRQMTKKYKKHTKKQRKTRKLNKKKQRGGDGSIRELVIKQIVKEEIDKLNISDNVDTNTALSEMLVKTLPPALEKKNTTWSFLMQKYYNQDFKTSDNEILKIQEAEKVYKNFKSFQDKMNDLDKIQNFIYLILKTNENVITNNYMTDIMDYIQKHFYEKYKEVLKTDTTIKLTNDENEEKILDYFIKNIKTVNNNIFIKIVNPLFFADIFNINMAIFDYIINHNRQGNPVRDQLINDYKPLMLKEEEIKTRIENLEDTEESDFGFEDPNVQSGPQEESEFGFGPDVNLDPTQEEEERRREGELGF